MGVVLSEHGWRSAFWLIAALLVVAMVAVAATTRPGGPRVPARFDVPGAVVLAVTLVVILLAITNGRDGDGPRAPVVALVLAAVTMMAWWVRWERSRADPVVDLAINGRGPVLLAHLGGVMVGCATFAQYITTFALVVDAGRDRLRVRPVARRRRPAAAPGRARAHGGGGVDVQAARRHRADVVAARSARR